MIKTDLIKDYYGRIIGRIETDMSTNIQTAKDYYFRVLGRYYPRENVTKDFYNRVVGRGNQLTGLIFQANAEGNK